MINDYLNDTQLLAIGFGNPLMFAALLACAIPILLHLWSRRRFQQHSFAAIQLLQRAMERHSRRIAIESWLLLAVRTVAIFLFVLALVDPIFDAKKSNQPRSIGDGDTLWILAIDVSYSMDMKSDGTTRLQRAKQSVARLAEAAGSGDAFQLLAIGPRSQTLIQYPTFDKRKLLEQVDKVELSNGAVNLAVGMGQVESLLDDQSNSSGRFDQIRVLFFTDLDQTGWQDIYSDPCSDLLRSIASKADCQIDLVTDESTSNLAIEEIRLESNHRLVGQPLRVSARVGAFGLSEPQQTRLRLLINGRQIWERTIEVPVASKFEESFDVVVTSPGDHFIEFEIDDARLDRDNRRGLMVNVASSRKVLLVGGRKERLRSLEYAICPLDEMKRQIDVQRVAEYELATTDVQAFDLIVVDNCSIVARDQVDRLAKWVESGGRMIIGLGDLWDRSRLNEDWYSSHQLIPGRLIQNVPSGEYRFDPLDYQHPLIDAFRGFPNAGLLSTPIFRYGKIAIDGDLNPEVVANFDDEDPAILVHRKGQGTVITFTSQLTEGLLEDQAARTEIWSAFSGWPSFVPLIQESFLFLLSANDQRQNILVGEAVIGQGISATESRIVVEFPDGTTTTLEKDTSSRSWAFGETWQLGRYTVSEGQQVLRTFSTALDTNESDLQAIQLEQLPSQLHQFTSQLTTPATVIPPLGTRPFQWLLLGLVGLLLIECWLARIVGRPLLGRIRRRQPPRMQQMKPTNTEREPTLSK